MLQATFFQNNIFLNYIFIIVIVVSKGNLLETLPIWGRFYTVEADITVTKIPDASWTNVFHFTKEENVANYGDRIPFVNINKAGYFYISSAVSGDKNYAKYFYFDVGKKYHLKIQQIQGDSKIIYEVLVDGNTIYSGENTDPKDFQNVKVYACNPWDEGAFTSEYRLLENFKYSRPV